MCSSSRIREYGSVSIQLGPIQVYWNALTRIVPTHLYTPECLSQVSVTMQVHSVTAFRTDTRPFRYIPSRRDSRHMSAAGVQMSSPQLCSHAGVFHTGGISLETPHLGLRRQERLTPRCLREPRVRALVPSYRCARNTGERVPSRARARAFARFYTPPNCRIHVAGAPGPRPRLPPGSAFSSRLRCTSRKCAPLPGK